MTFNDCINLCYSAAFDDPLTRNGLRGNVVPRLRKQAEELKAARELCEQREDWLREWESAGMVEREKEMLAAIDHMNSRLAAA